MQQFTPQTQWTLYSALPWGYPRNDEHHCSREGPITTTEKKSASRSHEVQSLLQGKGGTEEHFRNHILFNRLVMLGPSEIHPGCVPRTKLATWSTGRQSRCPAGQIIKRHLLGTTL